VCAYNQKCIIRDIKENYGRWQTTDVKDKYSGCVMDNMNYIVVGIGVALVIIGIFAQVFAVTTEDEALGGLIQTEDVERPYQQFGLPLIIGGVVVVLIGLFIPGRRTQSF